MRTHEAFTRVPRRGVVILVALFAALVSVDAVGQVRLRTASDRAAFTSWFLLLVDAQFYRTTPDVTDCASLVRHAAREAVRPHTEEWLRRMQLPVAPLAPDLVERPRATADRVELFRIQRAPAAYAEFADARTIVELNAQPLGRDVSAASPGDLLYFRRDRQRVPDHLMVFLGRSALSPGALDWVVYHTGPAGSPGAPTQPGEVRKVRLADLLRHPSPEWRPVEGNAFFVGVFRLDLMLNR
jgi:uncharacterized protein YfaT (DUF1175 family)